MGWRPGPAFAALLGVLVTSAGCSLFLIDGLSTDEPAVIPSADSGALAEASPSGEGGPRGAGPDAPGGSAYAAVVMSDVPFAYYPLDDTSGDRVRDLSGRGRDGFLVDVSRAEHGVLGVSASTGTAIRLKSLEGIQVGDGFDFAGRVPVTIEAWVRPDPQPRRLGWRRIFSNLELQNGPVSGNYFYWNDDDANRVAFERWSGRESRQTVALDRGTPLPTDRFTHVVGVATGTETLLYIDGQQVATGLVLGDCAANGVPASFGINFFGTLDELAIYDRALPVERVKAHHAAGRGTF
jgi:hypothetical protein